MGILNQERTEVFSVIVILETGPIIINSKDIMQCYFIEDIFSYCMTGKLIFNDMYGFVEYGPFTGNEQIIIAYGIDESIQLQFDIWKINKIQQSSPMGSTSESLIELVFVDPTFELYTLKRYSKSFNGDIKTTDIIKRILTSMLGINPLSINIEESYTSLNNFIIPYWTPMESIKWLMKRSKGKSSNTSGYLCFNSTNKHMSVNVYTLNYLMDIKNYIDLDIYNFENEGNNINKVLDWSISGIDKGSTKFLRGGVWKGYDSSTKSFIKKEYKYSDGIKDSVLMGKKSLFNDISDIQTVNDIIGEKDINTINNIIYDGWSRRYNVQQVISIIVDGHEKRHAGHQIEVKWPSTIRQQLYNKMMKGKFLIKSITHMFNGSNMTYSQRMVLIKNCYSNIDMVSLLNASKKNIHSIGKNSIME